MIDIKMNIFTLFHQQTTNVVKRFPLVLGVLAVVLITGWGCIAYNHTPETGLFLNRWDYQSAPATIWLILNSLATAAGLLIVAATLHREVASKNRTYRPLITWLAVAGGLVITCLLRHAIISTNNISETYLAIWFACLFLGCVYFFLKTLPHDLHAKGLVYLIQQGIFTGLIGGTLMVGYILGWGLSDMLLDFSWEELTPYYAYTVFILGAIYFLATLTTKKLLDAWQPLFIWKILGFYVVGGLLLCYNIIAYLYLAQGIITNQWAQRSVVHVFLWFVCASIVWLNLIPTWLKAKLTPRLSLARTAFLASMIPHLAIIGWGIAWRVSEHGWTGNRILVSLLTVWAGATIVFQLLSKKLSTAKILLMLTGIVLAGVAIGVPLDSQVMPARSSSGGASHTNERYFHYNLRDIDTLVTMVSGYDALLEINYAPGDKLVESTTPQDLTYTWQGTGEEVVFQLHYQGQLIYSYPVGVLVKQINEECQSQHPGHDNDFTYGCINYATSQKIGPIHPRTEQLDFVDNGQAVQVQWQVNGWGGYYDVTTNYAGIDSFYARILVKLP